MAEMSVEERYKLVARNTQEIITAEELKKLLAEKKQPSIYLGTAPTSTPHIGYFVWAQKMTDFANAGFRVKLLLADLHAALDNTPWELVDARYEYYKTVIPAIFKSLGADLSKIEIIKGSDYQLTKEYVYDLLKMSTHSSVNDAMRAASEVVKMGESPKLSGLIYPLMQSLDEEYLKVDAQFGGLDQRKILVFAREHLPKIGYARRIEIMSPLIPGLTASGKMSSSEPGSKIALQDDPRTVEKKIMSAYCPEKQIENNGIIAFCKYVIMVQKEDKKETFTIERPEKFGGNAQYSNYSDLEADFKSGKLHPQDLKKAVAKEINKLIEPIHKVLEGKEDIINKAYPA
ncbi:tyrosine--tRNA ligase [Candidatus Woesearchaeota archaeon]|nr:MAG: tyrosine--tRNA ligase [Candidatus Woesearchaeota archaeon]